MLLINRLVWKCALVVEGVFAIGLCSMQSTIIGTQVVWNAIAARRHLENLDLPVSQKVEWSFVKTTISGKSDSSPVLCLKSVWEKKNWVSIKWKIPSPQFSHSGNVNLGTCDKSYIRVFRSNLEKRDLCWNLDFQKPFDRHWLTCLKLPFFFFFLLLKIIWKL